MSEQDPNDGTQPDADEDVVLAEEIAAITKEESAPEGKQSKLVSAVIAKEKAIRALNKRVKELEPAAARAADVEGRLNAAQPMIDALVNSPKWRAEALRISKGEGTRQSSEASDQPEDDKEATEHAEDYGMYLSDNVTPDTARARRALNRIAGITGRQTDERMRPLAGGFLGQRADDNLRQALAMTDDDGVPLASEQSIRDTWKMLPANLLANPDVVELAINNAIGLDRRNRRTPKAPVEPLYVEGQTNRRSAGPTITAEEKARAERLGLTEKDLQEASRQLSTGKAITFGGR